MTAGQQPSVSPDASPGEAPSVPIYTIGYGARSIDQLVSVLKCHQVEFLVDIRSAPYSRFKPEFSKEPLEAALKAQGIRYLFMGDTLGGQPADPDCYRDGKVNYEIVRAKPFFRSGLDRLSQAWKQQRRVVLMCSEGRPEECHRTKLIGEALAALDLPVKHIDETDQLRSQAEILDRLTGGQLDLFGQPTFTSRKRYGPGRNDQTAPGD